MWKAIRRTALIFPPARKLRTQLHQNASQIEQLTRELQEARAGRNAAIESLHRKQPQPQERGNLVNSRELEEARRQNRELVERTRELEARCASLEHDYYVSVDAQKALLKLTQKQGV